MSKHDELEKTGLTINTDAPNAGQLGPVDASSEAERLQNPHDASAEVEHEGGTEDQVGDTTGPGAGYDEEELAAKRDRKR